MRLFLRSPCEGGPGRGDAASTCSLDLNLSRGSGSRLELPLERRGRAGSAGRLVDEDRLSMSSRRSVDSLENGDVLSLLDTPVSQIGEGQLLKPWASGGGKAGGLSLDLSHMSAYEGGESGNQTPGSMVSTPSPLETSAKAFPDTSSASLTEDSFLFSDNVSLGESFSCAEVRHLSIVVSSPLQCS